MSFTKGDALTVLAEIDANWVRIEVAGRSGRAPKQYINLPAGNPAAGAAPAPAAPAAPQLGAAAAALDPTAKALLQKVVAEKDYIIRALLAERDEAQKELAALRAQISA